MSQYGLVSCRIFLHSSTLFQEGPSLEDKRSVPAEADGEEREDVESERPVVVVLRQGDLTQEEADRLMGDKKASEGIFGHVSLYVGMDYVYVRMCESVLIFSFKNQTI